MASPSRVKRFLANLSTIDDAHFCAALANAARLGIGDMRKRKQPRSGAQIITAIGFTKWTAAHERMFVEAYTAGRQQAVLAAQPATDEPEEGETR